ncbi:hypothetical protein [Vibrio splendidus]|uniref:hypothetical protein n=1 Tax=Vibrio splendidus TaxID=29497 RepID=UPI0018E41CF2|nr:hypothetical protein [Vibrio splendidus]
MMNVCESIKGASYDEAAEVVNTLWPNGNESRKGVGHWPFVIKVLSALEWASKLTFYVTYGTG